MAKIKRFDENEIKLRNTFYFIYDEKDIEFLKSLKLTDEQNANLSRLIENYGQDKYSEGYTDGCQNESY